MKSFKEFININEARSRGEAMEEVIIAAINGKPISNNKYGIDAEAGQKVAEFLKRNGVSGKGEVLGASTIEVTKEWSKFWDGKVPSATKTPKTDFIVGKDKISLKSGDSSQLMSGGKNESIATFYSALEKTKGSMLDEVANKLTSMIEDLATSGVASSNLTTVIKSQSDELVNKVNKAHKELKNELVNIFQSNTSFRDAFAYEAMSGETKFGGNLGTCTHFLVTGFDGEGSKLHSVRDSSYVSNIANQMKVSVRFKSDSVEKNIDGKKVKTGEYRYWSVIGLILDKMNEDIEMMMNDDIYLTEGRVADFFKGVWERIKKFMQKAISYIKSGVKNMFDFLGVTPDISLNNKIRF